MSDGAPDDGLVAGLDRSTIVQLAVVAIVIVGVIGPPAITAATSFFSASQGTHWQTDSGLTVRQAEAIDHPSGGPFAGSDTLALPGGNVSAPGTGFVEVGDLTGSTTLLTQLDASSTTITVEPVDKHNLSVTGAASRVEWNNVTLQDETTDLWVTAPSGQSTTITVKNLPAGQYVQVYNDGQIVEQKDVANDGTFQFQPSGSGSKEAYAFVAGSIGSAPTLSNPAPISMHPSIDVDSIDIDVDDPDFPDERVQVWLFFEGPEYQNGTIYRTNISSAQRVETPLPTIRGGNQYNYTWFASDDEGNTVNYHEEFTARENQTVRNASDRSEVLDNTTIRVRYHEPHFDGDTVIERNTTVGNISVAGVPVNKEWIAVIRGDGFHKRKVPVSGIIEQPSLYLLSKSVETVYQRFVLLDKTGKFDDNSTRLVIDRALNSSNATQWYTVAGDYFGADGQFRIHLEKGVRYRLTLINRNGLTKTLGNYHAEDEVNPKKIEVGQLGIVVPDEEPYLHRSWIEETPDNQTDRIHISYSDPNLRTTRYCVQIHERGEPQQVVYQQCPKALLGNYSATVEVNQSKTWAVNWSAIRVEDEGIEEIVSTRPLGGNFEIEIPLGPPWLFGIAMLVVAGIPALADKRNAGYVSIGTVAVAGIFIYVGWIDVFAPFWVIAMVTAAGITIRRRQRRQF